MESLMELCSTPGRAQNATRNWVTSATAKEFWLPQLKVERTSLVFSQFHHEDIVDCTSVHTAVQTGFCSQPWIPYNGHCFQLNRTTTTWSNAHLACRKEGGDLVSIRNVEDQSFVISQLGYGTVLSISGAIMRQDLHVAFHIHVLGFH